MLSKQFIYLVFISFTIWACSGDTSQIETLYEKEDVSRELVTDVQILYSDSARVYLKVMSPLLVRKEVDKKVVEEFPEGLYVEFFHGSSTPQSWLKADKATRYPADKTIVLKGNVELYNRKNDKLESSEIIWNEETEEITTEKFVRITQPERGDTTYGFGFVSNRHFDRFEIKKKFSGKIEESFMNSLK